MQYRAGSAVSNAQLENQLVSNHGCRLSRCLDNSPSCGYLLIFTGSVHLTGQMQVKRDQEGETEVVLSGFEGLSQKAWPSTTKLLLQVIIPQGGHYSAKTGEAKHWGHTSTPSPSSSLQKPANTTRRAFCLHTWSPNPSIEREVAPA